MSTTCCMWLRRPVTWPLHAEPRGPRRGCAISGGKTGWHSCKRDSALFRMPGSIPSMRGEYQGWVFFSHEVSVSRQVLSIGPKSPIARSCSRELHYLEKHLIVQRFPQPNAVRLPVSAVSYWVRHGFCLRREPGTVGMSGAPTTFLSSTAS